jgi:SsrA-binding protein
MKKRRPSTGKIINRRARFDYELGDDLVVGIKLTGKETKSLRQGHAHLRGAFVTLKDDQLVLSNATIASGKTFIIPDTEQTQARALLAKRKEIDALKAAKDSGKSIVPLEFLTSGRYVKLRIAIGKGKKRYDKRQTIKERDQARDIRNLA